MPLLLAGATDADASGRQLSRVPAHLRRDPASGDRLDRRRPWRPLWSLGPGQSGRRAEAARQRARAEAEAVSGHRSRLPRSLLTGARSRGCEGRPRPAGGGCRSCPVAPPRAQAGCLAQVLAASKSTVGRGGTAGVSGGPNYHLGGTAHGGRRLEAASRRDATDRSPPARAQCREMPLAGNHGAELARNGSRPCTLGSAAVCAAGVPAVFDRARVRDPIGRRAG